MMEALHLGHNQLTGDLLQGGSSSSLAVFQTLKILDLKYNKLVGTLPPSYEGLSSIQTLDLSNNKFQGEYNIMYSYISVIYSCATRERQRKRVTYFQFWKKVILYYTHIIIHVYIILFRHDPCDTWKFGNVAESLPEQ